MSIGPVSTGSVWSLGTADRTRTGEVSARAAAVVTPHPFLPNDPANVYLTDTDRVAVRNATGVDVRADGGIASPVSMDAETYGRVLLGVGQIASDRANGRLTGPLTLQYLNRVLGASGNGQPAAAFSAAIGLDVST